MYNKDTVKYCYPELIKQYVVNSENVFNIPKQTGGLWFSGLAVLQYGVTGLRMWEISH